uniref:GS catalytic domain-containing protein n=2 Tax=Davidia involucrata TaxID=16924 RepID=A0A5B7B468_DAVIN
MERYEELKQAVERVEIVDAHAHDIFLDSTLPFHQWLTGAKGEALSHASLSLPFKRSLRDIAELYGSEISLHGIEEYRRCSGLQSIGSKCFRAARISTMLIDEEIGFDQKHDTEWHRSFTPVFGRILNIECLAEKILNEEMRNGSMWTLDTFDKIFVGKLKSVADGIVSLKSIAISRCGLEININVTKKDAEEGLIEVLSAGKPVRIMNKSFVDYIFLRSLEVAVCFDLPMQIDIGFGDKDFDLRLSNPLHLRALLEDKKFSKCRIVLLHASYPFSKEALYLASSYPQVYLDFGLAISKLSVCGITSSVKELLKLAPIKKVMFSSDGYAIPETFYLGARRAREVVFSVLRDACIDGDLSIPEAIEAAKDIFSRNAIQFYKIIATVRSFDPEIVVSRNLVETETNATQNDVICVRIIWIDSSGQSRCRVVPVQRFYDDVRNNGVIVSASCMGRTTVSVVAVEGSGTAVRLIPDLSTKWQIPWAKQEEMVLADMFLNPSEAYECCPRGTLRRVLKILKDEFNLVMNAGFENEFYLLKSVSREGREEWVPFDSTPYASTSAYDAASDLFHEIITALQSLNIPVEQVHSEVGRGQFEVTLGHTVCDHAADNLIFSREVIRALARKHGLLATFMPKYILDDIGSGAHVHISLWENGENVFMASNGYLRHGMSKIGEEFMAGVLNHLPSILAFTAPLPNSYDRMQPTACTPAYICWGKKSREATLRTSYSSESPDLVSNFEVRSFDGCANPYLGLASIVAAGIDGLRRHLSLPEPMDSSPNAELRRLPMSLSESVEALQEDIILRDLIGEKLSAAIIAVCKAEIDYYSKNEEAYKQLIHIF